jgi:hypothetical protein
MVTKEDFVHPNLPYPLFSKEEDFYFPPLAKGDTGGFGLTTTEFPLTWK